MTKNTKRTIRPVNDYQIFKGACEQSMKPFGGPVMALHEAQLLVRDDQNNLAPGMTPLYAIYKRSKNEIVRILETPRRETLLRAA